MLGSWSVHNTLKEQIKNIISSSTTEKFSAGESHFARLPQKAATGRLI
jgi:hypothetical protein